MPPINIIADYLASALKPSPVNPSIAANGLVAHLAARGCLVVNLENSSAISVTLRDIALQLRDRAAPLPDIGDKYDDAKACHAAQPAMLNAANGLELAAAEIDRLRTAIAADALHHHIYSNAE